MSLVGPGTLTEYEGPSRGRRQRGSVRVQKPAQGYNASVLSLILFLFLIFSLINFEVTKLYN